MRHVHLLGFARQHRPAEILDRSPSIFLQTHPLIRCLSVYKTMPWRFALTLFLLILVNGSLTWYQYLIGVAVNELELGKLIVSTSDGGLDAGRAQYWAVVLIAIALGRAVLQYVSGVAALITGQELLFRIRDAILVQVQRLDLGYHLRHGIGEMVSRTTRDADKVRDALISFWRNVIETGLVMVACLTVLAWYAPLLALVPTLLATVGVFLFVRQADSLVVLDRAVGSAYDSVSQDLLEGVGGVRVIKAFSLENARITRFNAVVAEFARLALQAIRYSAVNIPIPQIVVALGQVWVFVWGARLVTQNELNVGEFVAAVLVMNTLIFRFEGVGRIVQIFADARSSAGRIMDFLDAQPTIRSGATRLPEGPLGFRLRNVDVWSRDAGGVQILKQINLEVAPGEIVALVGATGSGKSTIAALLPRLLDASSGVVEVGSAKVGFVAVTELALPDLRRRVHVAAQDCFLFSDTVAENLRVVAPDATDTQLREALRLAEALEIIDELPEGLDTRVGDRGVTLSGGQRQRLALARAFVAFPAIMVLDDSTSALDAVTEQKILHNVRSFGESLGESPTLLLVASKPSTVFFAHRILVLDEGKIVASGSHQELVTTSSTYCELMGIDNGN
jgi:ATP-binding cassette, subfamily B, bacterial